MRIGARVVMTPKGEALAATRKLRALPGIVRDEFGRGRKRQIYVRRDGAGCEWWPLNAWRVEGD